MVGPDGYVLPATQHDVVVWLAGVAYDVVFDLSLGVMSALASHAVLAHEIVGWPYHRDLDLTGFIDGTENPTLVDATAAAIVEPDAPGEGGSVLLLQQWEHDAIRWNALPVPDQEQVIGRRKADSAELDLRPETSHIVRTDQDDFGRIFRRNIAYGTLTDHGTIFVGFSRDRARLEAMLESMIGRGNGPPDALTAFTRPLTGAYYFVPSSEAVATFAGESISRAGPGLPASPL
jgi:putative iron-dependent peroxidase